MVRALPLLLLLAAGPAVQAQADAFGVDASVAGASGADVFGVVVDAETGGPVPGATVALVDAAGTITGRAAGTEGEFAVRGLAPGRYLLRVSAVGYASATDTLALADGERRNLAVELAPRTATLGGVEIEADDVPVTREAGLERLRPADLAVLPSGDPGGDLATALLAQAGVTTAGDRGGQLAVRGGTPTQNLVLIDGIPLFQPFHLLGGYSALPAGVVRSADVYAGGWPARFGGRIASVVDVIGRTGSKRRVAAAATVSPILVGAELEVPVVPGEVSLMASVRQSVLATTDGAIGVDLPYDFSDAFAKVHARLDATSSLQATALRATDRGDPGRLGDRLTTTTEAAGGQFFSISSAFAAAIDISAYWSRYRTTFAPVGQPFRAAEATVFGGRFGYVYYLGPHTVRTGLQASSYFFDYAFRPDADTRRNTSEGSVFVDADLDLGEGWRMEPGARFQTFPSQAQPASLEPRLQVSWAGGGHVLNAAAGVYRQEIIGLTDQRDVGDVFTAWTTTQEGFPVPTATHGLVGWEGPVGGGLRLGVEGYTKVLSGQTLFTAGRVLSTNGRAFGADVSAQFRRPGVRLDARYGASSVTYRDAVNEYQPPFHRPHRLSVNGRVEYGRFAAAAAVEVTSGRPYTRVAGAFRDLGGGPGPIPIDASGPVVVLLDPQPFGARTPAYARLDVSVEYAVELSRARAVLQAAVLNATDRANVFYYDAVRAERVDQLPLLPTLGLRVEVR